ncbi:hypothetical protein BH10PLA1_BH10PLA1_08830 [soil metagenome]
MLEPSIAAKADYADAILVARRAKNWLFLLLLIVLVGEIALFFVANKTNFIESGSFAPGAATQPATSRVPAVLQYLVALAGFAGVAGSILLSVVLILLVKIMLTARTLGVGRVTSAFIWSTLLIILLFPWQAILAGPTISSSPDPMANDFKIPGVIYTWSELMHPTLGAKFTNTDLRTELKVLRWARFVGFPVLATMILLSIQVKSSMGIKAAIGDDALPDPATNV